MANLDKLGRILTADRQKDQELSLVARAAICSAVACGTSRVAVARAFGVSPGTVTKTVDRFRSSSSFKSGPRTRRPRALTRRDRRYIVQLAKRDPRLTHKQLLRVIGRKASVSTVRRALREQRYRKWKAAKRIPLSIEAAKARYDFARHWLQDTADLEEVCNRGVAPPKWLLLTI